MRDDSAYFICKPAKAWVTEGLAREAAAEGVRSQEIARTRRSQETIFGENPEFRRSLPILVLLYFFAPSALLYWRIAHSREDFVYSAWQHAYPNETISLPVSTVSFAFLVFFAVSLRPH